MGRLADIVVLGKALRERDSHSSSKAVQAVLSNASHIPKHLKFIQIAEITKL